MLKFEKCKMENIVLVVVAIILLNVSETKSMRMNGRSIKRSASALEQANAVKDLLVRLIPEQANSFNITVDFEFEDKDAFEISTIGKKVNIIGNRGFTAAAGVYHYLKVFCKCHVSWSGNQLHIPEILPTLSQPLKITFNDKYRYYQNVCTYSYSYVWWSWERWEKEIDWMALNGINLALAFTAQEAIFQKVFSQLNFTEHDLGVFFTGPAFLAWNRMGNMQAWVGPLTNNWHAKQVVLQHNILDRMRAFGMTPVLPAFSGRVPPAFNRVFPEANTTILNKTTWGHFKPPFGFVTFLQPIDPLFERIGSEFLRTYIDEFGTDHIYSADLFNEMPPPSNDTRYLQSCSKALFRSLISIDPNATWLVQGWMFHFNPEVWQEAETRAFLRAVPLGKIIILDLQSELYPQYHQFHSYYGQPFIWCMLHNYGGVKGLYGSLESINQGPFEGRNFNGSTMIGTGLTPEGIETNDIIYEFMNEMAWRKNPVDINVWIEDFALRRYGTNSSDLILAWHLLKKSVYNATAPVTNHGKCILIRRPSLKLAPFVWYDPENVYEAWKHFRNASQNSTIEQSHLYRHDLVDLTRQSLQLIMDGLYSKVVAAYKKKSIQDFVKYARSILDLFNDMDEILASDGHFLLGTWLHSAKQLAETELERVQYEYNARNQITLWGPSGEILDYANKQWAGLITQYYRKRWQLFFQTLLDSLMHGIPFKQSDFNQDVYEQIEYEFDLGTEIYPIEAKGDSIEISRRLLEKYLPL